MLKRILGLLCALTVTAAPVQAALDTAVWDAKANTICLTGSLTGQSAALLAYLSAAEQEIAEGSLPDGEIGGTVLHMAELGGDAALPYTFSILQPEEAAQVTVVLTEDEAESSLQLYCYSEAYRETLVNSLNGAAAEAVATLLEDAGNRAVLGLDDTFLCGDMQGVYQQISRLPLTGNLEDKLAQLGAAWTCACFFATIGGADAETIQAALQQAQMQDLTEPLFGNPEKAAYYYRCTEKQQLELLTALPEAEDYEAWRNGFYTTVALHSIAYLRYGYMEELLTAFAAELDLTPIPSGAKETVYRGIAGQRFATVQALNSRIAALLPAKGGSGGGGSGGGGGSTGGKGGGVSIVPDKQISAYLPEQAQTLPEPDGFSDMQNYAWAAQAVAALQEKGIVSGYADGSFRPEGLVTRAEMLKLLTAAFAIDQPCDRAFFDVPDSHWVWPFLNRSGTLARGDEANCFRPDETVRREDMAVLLCRAMGRDNERSENATPFLDDAEISAYAKDAVYLLKELQIVQGNGAGFLPQAGATRAEAAVMIARAMELR